MKVKKFLLMAIFFLAILLLSACGQSASSGSEGKPTIKIGYLPITHAVPLYMQKEMLKKTEKSFNLELVQFSSWPNLMDALNTGRIDGASSLITVAMRAKEQGIDLKAVALGHRDGNVLVGSKDIKGVSDLKGETFAIPHKFSTHNILLYAMLKQAGMNYKDVNAVEMAPAEMPAALSQGRIAGYVVAEPFGAQSVVLGNAKVLHQSEELWQDSVDCALILQGDFIENNKDAAQDFVDSYVKAGSKAEAKDEHVKEISSKYMEVDKEVMDLSLKWISYDNLKINKDAYEQLSQYLIEMGLLENPPAYDEFVDNTLINKAK
ncbi:ABC transporter substrate-binding protein [Virgibacillus sp. L01]|uniref:ABC transporter substrate-binding protein n=1 Tax=Virgibacillus sp. L01 TaxID=3457429 RepID=UPI003FD3FAA7